MSVNKKPVFQNTEEAEAWRARHNFLNARTSKLLLIINALLALLYFVFITFFLQRGYTPLFYVLIAGEVFHVWQIWTYLYTVWQPDYQALSDENYLPEVDVYITIAGEPMEIVAKTAEAVLAMDYPNFNVYLLNDGYVAEKENWKEIQQLAKKLRIHCITRKIAGGAKAGNINHALVLTRAPFVAIFDADHVPHRDFLKKTLPYFIDEKMAFVQSPQFYKNYQLNEVTGGSWEQQELFFGPMCRGKNRLNSVFMCGTNMVVRKTALLQAGGMCETNIAEDFLTSLFIHQHGWKSLYVPEVLAEGLAPEDPLSYIKQQFRWARGSLEILFKYNPLFRRGLTWAQKIQYLSSSSFYLTGLVVAVDALLPIILFFTGKVPIATSTMSLAAIFLPYMFVTIVVLKLTSDFSLTFRAVAYSISSFPIHIRALWSTITGRKEKFAVTSKHQLSGNFLYLTTPHLVYLGLTAVGVVYALLVQGPTAAVLSNLAWALFNSTCFMIFISATVPQQKSKEQTWAESPALMLQKKPATQTAQRPLSNV